MAICLRFIALLAAIMAYHAAHAEAVLLGVLEDVPGTYTGEHNSTKVRVLFKHTSEGWRAYPSDCADQACLGTVTHDYPHKATWSVIRMGRQIGKLRGLTPSKFQYYSHIGLQNITGGKIPDMGKPSAEFGNFSVEQLRRPLVAVSLPPLRRTTVWRSSRVSLQIRHLAFYALHSRFAQVCNVDESDRLTPYFYREQDLKIRLYRSGKAESVMSVGLDDMYDCQGEGNAPLAPATFVINKAGDVRFLGEGFQFVDAGDFAGDGQTELLFAYSGYNRGGYVLLSSAWIEQARFVFSYH